MSAAQKNANIRRAMALIAEHHRTADYATKRLYEEARAKLPRDEEELALLLAKTVPVKR